MGNGQTGNANRPAGNRDDGARPVSVNDANPRACSSQVDILVDNHGVEINSSGNIDRATRSGGVDETLDRSHHGKIGKGVRAQPRVIVCDSTDRVAAPEQVRHSERVRRSSKVSSYERPQDV